MYDRDSPVPLAPTTPGHQPTSPTTSLPNRSTAVLDVLRSLEAAAAPANANANAPHRGRLEEPPSDAAAGRAGASTLTPGLATPARRPAPSAASRQGLPVEAGMPPVAHDELLFAK